MVRSTRSEAESLPLTGSHARLGFDSFGGKTGGVRVVAALFSFRVEGSLGCGVDVLPGMNAGASTSAGPSLIEGSGTAGALLGSWTLSPACPTPIPPRHECRGFSALLVTWNFLESIGRIVKNH